MIGGCKSKLRGILLLAHKPTHERDKGPRASHVTHVTITISHSSQASATRPVRPHPTTIPPTSSTFFINFDFTEQIDAKIDTNIITSAG
ncbi:hypothetical protein RSOLAG1IB_08243 [Rhizoctonia solani AG-1 IB]|uniref:Uncharacterized protein n=1 Tax=Thanatephorus cucumeris (strain AG1-IB / isolate 7/3/14) TaxID=1108050 RepID=A0A0B7FH83_THACB|nr:hypothetical protein RSOLAG1IB_08243 [Rhizoctonia solani AG-1 IB]